jgi:hypothetical protein
VTSRAVCGSSGQSRSRPPLADQSDVGRHGEPEVLRGDVQELLDARAGVVEQGQEEIAPLARRSRPIDLRQQVRDFLSREGAEPREQGLLAREGQHALAMGGQGGLAVEDEPEEGMDRGEPGVPGAHAVVPDRLEMGGALAAAPCHRAPQLGVQNGPSLAFLFPVESEAGRVRMAPPFASCSALEIARPTCISVVRRRPLGLPPCTPRKL